MSELVEEESVVGELGGPLGEASVVEGVPFFPEVPPQIPPYSKQSPSVGRPEPSFRGIPPQIPPYPSKPDTVQHAPVDPRYVSSPESKQNPQLGSQVFEEKKERKGEKEGGGSVAVAASSSSGSSRSKRLQGGRAAGTLKKAREYLSISVIVGVVIVVCRLVKP